jgi:hypothetical protein
MEEIKQILVNNEVLLINQESKNSSIIWIRAFLEYCIHNHAEKLTQSDVLREHFKLDVSKHEFKKAKLIEKKGFYYKKDTYTLKQMKVFPYSIAKELNLNLEINFGEKIKYTGTDLNDLTEKCELLSDMIKATTELYHATTTNDEQRGLLETIIGAGIWYLPSHKNELYSGYASVALLEDICNKDLNEIKWTEEHSFPRKVAGNRLYSQYINEVNSNSQFLKELYLSTLGCFNIVTTNENNKLKKFATVDNFINDNLSYEAAEIHLVNFPLELFSKLVSIKKSNKDSNKQLTETNDELLLEKILKKKSFVNQTFLEIRNEAANILKHYKNEY